MDLNKLKSEWRSHTPPKVSQSQLMAMTQIKNHPNVKQLKTKLAIEAIMITILLAIYYDGFDGDQKSLWVNVVFIICSLAYIINRFLGWYVLLNPIKEGNLIESLVDFRDKLQNFAIFTLITTFMFGSSILLFFSSRINFTQTKYYTLVGMVITLIVLVFISGRQWLNRVKGIEITIKELTEF